MRVRFLMDQARFASDVRSDRNHRGCLAGPTRGSYYWSYSPFFRVYPSVFYGYPAPDVVVAWPSLQCVGPVVAYASGPAAPAVTREVEKW